MPRFLHASIGSRIEKDSFIRPELDYIGLGDFNLPGGFYLSMATDDDSSMWLELREKMKTYSPPKTYFLRQGGKKKKIVEEDYNSREYLDDDPWLGKNKHFYEVDFEEHKIYVIDSVEDIHKFFTEYGGYDFDLYTGNRKIDDKKDFLLGQLRKLESLEKFIENLDNCYKEKLKNTDMINTLKARRNFRNLSYVKIKNDIVVPKKKFRTEFLVDLIRTEEHLKRSIEKYITIKELRESMKISLKTVNYKKLNSDGYNGVYYTKNLIQFLPEDEIKKFHSEMMEKYARKESASIHIPDMMKKTDIGTLPKIHPDMSDKRSDIAKSDIEFYLRWLGSDTLIIWNWIF
jgi:hypothetical protein